MNDGLRLVRVFKKIKVKDMAAALGISPNYLSEIETGKKKPSIEVIQKYAEVWKTSPSVVLFFAGIENRPSITKAKIKNHLRSKITQMLRSIEREADEILQD